MDLCGFSTNIHFIIVSFRCVSISSKRMTSSLFALQIIPSNSQHASEKQPQHSSVPFINPDFCYNSSAVSMPACLCSFPCVLHTCQAWLDCLVGCVFFQNPYKINPVLRCDICFDFSSRLRRYIWKLFKSWGTFKAEKQSQVRN